MAPIQLLRKPKVEYRDDFVEYFDHFNCDDGSLLDLRMMVKQLRFADKKVQFWVKVKEVPTNKELDMYVEHLYDDQWDYEVEISRSLGDDALMTDEGSEQNSEREVDGPDNEFQEIDVEVNGPTSKHKVDEVEVEVDEVDCVHSEEIFRSLDDSDSERECFLAKLYKDEFRLNMEWGRRQFQEHVKQKLHCQSSELWHKVDLPAPLPPKYKAQPGRPKKKRKIDPLQESKQQKRPVRTKKVGEVKRCRVCGMTGHNKTTCKGKNPQVEGQAEVEGHSDVEGQADVEGHFDVKGQADVQG
nr:uncharacterized protein LOC109168401 [Ipomoea trifida]